MTTQTSGWKSAFTAFLDRRAFIMLFLGFSAGIPILLIFSSLSLWLGEAGIDKSAVTFFSWAALGYSFKFVWAPLVDELPVPFLTRILGRRRAWLLIAQCLIICAICIMAFSDPSLGQGYLIQMAVGAVLLGFSAATQDIVIDAYRIELAETQMQTVLASTYNAGYRIGMIVAGAGALFLAASMGTAKGNYIYSAWKLTYLTMAAVMLVGIFTTLVIREPKVERVHKDYKRSDYYRLVFVFFIAVLGFVLSYIYSGDLTGFLTRSLEIKDSFLLFCMEAVRFLGSAVVAVVVGMILVNLGAVNKQMALETWVAPIKDFFARYGVKLALVLLLLIGFYRISDIVSGVISNVFYQDLNFTKEQIAEAVKIYGVVFSLMGGFLGGLLAQKMNIMKLMFVGAILASSTNLMFIGLVKSGQDLAPVKVQVAGQSFSAQPDEVGYWSVHVPGQTFSNTDKITVTTQYRDLSDAASLNLPYLKQSSSAQILLFPITSDGNLSPKEYNQSLVIKGQFSNINPENLNKEKPFIVTLDGKEYPAKIEGSDQFAAIIAGKVLHDSPSKNISVKANFTATHADVMTSLQYGLTNHKATIDVDIQPVKVVNPQSQDTVEIKGKVIKPYSQLWLYAAIILDNLASGLAGAAFIAFLSSLTSVSFTAVQYAIFSSLMTLTPKIIGGYSGTIVTKVGYPDFFLITTLIGIPILILVVWVGKLLQDHEKSVETHNSN